MDSIQLHHVNLNISPHLRQPMCDPKAKVTEHSIAPMLAVGYSLVWLNSSLEFLSLLSNAGLSECSNPPPAG